MMEVKMKKPVKIINRKIDNHKNYIVRLELGLIASLLIFLFAFKMQFSFEEKVADYSVGEQEVFEIEEIVQTKQEVKAPPPPRPMVPVEVPNDEVIEDEIINIDAELNFDEVISLPPPPPQFDEAIEEEEEIFVVVEQPPVLIGGIQSVQKRIIYPELALKAGIEGRVVVQFVIDKNGDISDPVVVRGIGGGCDEEAVRALLQAKFKPGYQRGVPVSVRYTIPISFKINKDNI